MAARAYFYGLGKRKNARATVKLYPGGKGDITVNETKLTDWADTQDIRNSVVKPLEALGAKADYDIDIRVSGGGKVAQGEAASLGISRAIVRKDGETRAQLKEEGLLTRDSRRKERKKPGLKRARRAPQFSKR